MDIIPIVILKKKKTKIHFYRHFHNQLFSNFLSLYALKPQKFPILI